MIKHNRIVLLCSAALVAGCATNPPVAVDAAPAVAPIAPVSLDTPPAPLPGLVSQVDLPHEKFTLDNGLTVLVHEDHKAPVVAVSVYYNVGSKDEPKGKTGFAHLFEHLMFYGSDNVRESILSFLDKVGATDANGTTWYDRTNYYETVPKSALEKTLFMESDRMGYLLSAVDQKRVDLQRGVVQNEKRQRDNAPGGLVRYEVFDALLPPGHPYRHSTIGSMADLDAASLADVKQWFLDKYGPNNAVIALAGDITPAEARTLMQKYFGAIPRGKVNNPAQADVPTLAAPKRLELKDRVAATSVQKYWAVPGMLSEELAPLSVGSSVLGGLASSRLDRILVREEKLAVAVSADLESYQRIGFFTVGATVKPGVDPAVVEKRLDEIMADFVANGPTDDELTRASTSVVASQIRNFERVGSDGQASALAEGQVFAGDSNYYRRTLQEYAATRPEQVRATLSKWLSRPALTVVLSPGERPPYVEAKAGKAKSKAGDIKVATVKRDMPPAGPAPALDFPTIEHVKLSNGIPVDYAQRTAAPLTQLALAFDAGFAADPVDRRGLQNMTLGLLDEGAAGKTSQQIAEAKERLGSIIGASGSADRSTVVLSALSANLAPSLALVRDIVQRPDFAPAEIERVRTQTMTAIAQAKTNPGSIASRAIPALLYGANHPYATTSIGDEAAVKALTRDDLVTFKDRWLRPEKARLLVVSDRPLAELMPLLESAFGTWQAPGIAAGTKAFTAVPALPDRPRIVLINRPGSPQSVILAGQVTPVVSTGDIVPISGAADVFGGSTSARLSLDLREAKGWSYGAYGSIRMQQEAVPYLIQAPVQADRTADSIAAILAMLKDIAGPKGISPDELSQAVANNVDGLPGQFESGDAVLSAMQSMAQFGRPDDYYEQLGPRFRALTPAAADAAFRQAVNPNAFTFVVVGDAAKVKPQLEKLGLPIEEAQPR